MMDTAFLNGFVYREGRFEKTNVYLKKGIISKITNRILDAITIIDASGLWVLPGLIDPHVHFKLKVEETCSRDDFYAGSVLAAFGGVTTYIDFLDPIAEVNELSSAFVSRLEDAKESIVDYSFHTTIAGVKNHIEELGKLAVHYGMPSIKLFTTYASTGRQTKDNVIKELLRHSKKIGYRVLIHAENDNMIDESKGAKIQEHELRRPAVSEISEVIKLAQLTEMENGLCYIVHLNCGTTLEILENKYKALLDSGDLTVESCPHYLLMNNEKYLNENGYRYVMTPPLRSLKEQYKLKKNFRNIHIIGTDHCPYTEEQKKHNSLDQIPNGIEGIPYTLPSLMKEFGVSVLPKITHECAKIHGLYPRKGVIAEESEGDIVLFDPIDEWVVTGNEPWFRILSRNFEGSPYESLKMRGKVKSTFVRGHKVMEDAAIYPMKGQFIQRKAVL